MLSCETLAKGTTARPWRQLCTSSPALSSPGRGFGESSDLPFLCRVTSSLSSCLSAIILTCFRKSKFAPFPLPPFPSPGLPSWYSSQTYCRLFLAGFSDSQSHLFPQEVTGWDKQDPLKQTAASGSWSHTTLELYREAEKQVKHMCRRARARRLQRLRVELSCKHLSISGDSRQPVVFWPSLRRSSMLCRGETRPWACEPECDGYMALWRPENWRSDLCNVVFRRGAEHQSGKASSTWLCQGHKGMSMAYGEYCWRRYAKPGQSLSVFF